MIRAALIGATFSLPLLAQEPTRCIENGFVLDDKGEFERASLCMRDGRFIEPSTAADETVEVLDADGRYLMPPFAEAHIHTLRAMDHGARRSCS